MSEKLLYLANMCVSSLTKKRVPAESITEIVCVKWDEIGDMVTAIHVFRLLKNYAPQANITLLCKPFVGSLLCEEWAVDVIVHKVENLPTKADVWIELRGTWQTWWRSLWSGSKVRLDRGTVRFKQRGNQAHEILTNYRIIEPLVGNVTWQPEILCLGERENQEALQLLQERNLTRFMVVHPGGRSLLRRWNADKFAQVIQEVYRKYQWKSLVLGVEEESALVHEIVSKTQGIGEAWITSSSLLTLAAVMKKAELFIGNESGPLQIADVMQVRSIGLFGPGVKQVFYPQTEGSKVIHHILECNPCDQKVCIRPHDSCMDKIEVQEVLLHIG